MAFAFNINVNNSLRLQSFICGGFICYLSIVNYYFHTLKCKDKFSVYLTNPTYALTHIGLFATAHNQLYLILI
jgi:hypothetical protein